MLQWKKNLYVLFGAELLAVAGMMMIQPFLTLYIEELDRSFGSTELWAGLVYSLQAGMMLLTAPIWGAIADRYGRKVMVQRSMLGGAVIIGLMGLVTSVEQLTLLRTIQGAVTGVIPASQALIAASAPRERSGFALGVMEMGALVGFSIGPLLGGLLADAFGFRTAFAVTALLMFLAGLAVSLLVEEAFIPARVTRLNGSEMFRDWLAVLRAPRVNDYLSMGFLVQIGRTAIVPFLPLFVVAQLTQEQNAPTVTGLVVGVSGAAGALSAVYLGRLGDRHGQQKLILLAALAAAVGYGLLALSGEIWQLVLLFALIGVAEGGLIPGIAALLNNAAPPGKTSSVYGLRTSFMAAGRMLAPALGALIAGATSLQGVFVLAAAAYGAVAVMSRVGEREARLELGD